MIQYNPIVQIIMIINFGLWVGLISMSKIDDLSLVKEMILVFGFILSFLNGQNFTIFIFFMFFLNL